MSKRIIHTLFEQQVLEVPESIAVSNGHRNLTYRELNSKANRLAHTLRSLGLFREAVAFSLMPAGTTLVASLLAIHKAGGVYLPLDFSFPPAAMAHLAQVTNASFCLVAADWRERAQECFIKAGLDITYIVSVDEELNPAVFEWRDGIYTERPTVEAASCNPSLIGEPQDGSYIICTSGSAADPKPVIGTHDGLSHFIHWEKKEFNVRPGTAVSLLNPATSDASLRDIFLALTTGGRLHIPTEEVRTNAARLVSWIGQEGIGIVQTTPSFFRQLLRAADGQSFPAPALRHLLLSGEPLYGQDITDGRDVFGDSVEFVNLYGPAESTLAKTFHRINGPLHNDEFVPAGQPISNTMILVVNDDMICNVGEVGEIYISTPFLSKGYAGDAARTASSFVQNPIIDDRREIVFKTGDYGRYLPGHSLQVLNRTGSESKVNGFKVDVAALRETVLSCEGVESAEVIVYESSVINPLVLCYYTGAPGGMAPIRATLEANFAAPVLPAYYIRLDTFPLTVQGKINKKELPLPGEIMAIEQEAEAPRGTMELALEAICKEILDLKKVSRRVSFFKIGGVSVKAMQYIFRIYKDLGVLLTFEEFYENSTIEKLAAFLTAQTSGGVKPLTGEEKDEMESFRQSMMQAG